jgi:hypothetical protein
MVRSVAEVNKDKKRGGRRGREGFYSGADSDIDKMTGKSNDRKRIRIDIRVRGEEGCEKKKGLEPGL